MPRRALLICAIAFAAVTSCTAADRLSLRNLQADGNQIAEPVITVRAMTYNIHHAQGTDGKLNVSRIADVIAAQNVDIVGLQELDRYYSSRSEYRDEPKEIAQQLGWNYVFADNLNLQPTADTPAGVTFRQYGTMILTRFPILKSDNTYLYKYLPTAEQRGLAQALVQVGMRQIWFFNTHLSAAGIRNGENGPLERTVQVKQVIDIVKNVTSASDNNTKDDVPFILTGDFNARPDQNETQPLFKVFQDSWPAINGPAGGFTIESENPDRRIDYIFTSQEFKVKEVHVPVEKVASDHRPVVAELRFTEGAPGAV